MKRFAPFLILLIIGCSESPKNTINDGNISSSNLSDTCDCAELVIDSLGNHFLDSTHFTGICISYYLNSKTKYLEKNLFAGKLHGQVIYYDREGEQLLREVYENGKQKRMGGIGQSLVCDCNELTKSKSFSSQTTAIAKLDDIPFTGKCEKYFPNSKQLSMEVNYKNGLLDGYTIYYNQDGSTILMERYSDGELVSTVN